MNVTRDRWNVLATNKCLIVFSKLPVAGMRRAIWALFMSGGRNHPAGEIQVGERQQREHLRAILGEAAIAYLAIAELAFDDPEHVLDFRTHLKTNGRATLVRQRPVMAFASFSRSRSPQGSFAPRVPPAEQGRFTTAQILQTPSSRRDATRYCLSASPVRSGARPRPCAEFSAHKFLGHLSVGGPYPPGHMGDDPFGWTGDPAIALHRPRKGGMMRSRPPFIGDDP